MKFLRKKNCVLKNLWVFYVKNSGSGNIGNLQVQPVLKNPCLKFEDFDTKIA
jgi:hypothetical protein